MGFKDIAVKPSSNIGAVQYDEDTGQLAVTFKRGGEVQPDAKPYIYPGVPPSAVADFAAADSSGSHFAKNIRGIYAAVAPEKEGAE